MSPSTVMNAQLSGLIGRFYDAAADETLWTGKAADVAASLDSNSAVLKFHGANDDIRFLESTENLHFYDRQQYWAAHWHRQDLWAERSAQFGQSRVVTDHDLVSRVEQHKRGFYQGW